MNSRIVLAPNITTARILYPTSIIVPLIASESKPLLWDADRESHDSAKQLVDTHVYANISIYINYAIESSYEDSENAPVTYKDLYDFAYYYSHSLDERLSRTELLLKIQAYQSELLGFEEFSDQEAYGSILDELTMLLKNDSWQMPDILEWYIVSYDLAIKLKAAGEVVLNNELWGRQTTGQPVYLDACIHQIANM